MSGMIVNLLFWQKSNVWPCRIFLESWFIFLELGKPDCISDVHVDLDRLFPPSCHSTCSNDNMEVSINFLWSVLQLKPLYKNLEFLRSGWTGSYIIFTVVFHNSGWLGF